MRNNCKICWIILALFLIGNVVLLGFWWFDNDEKPKFGKQKYKKEDNRIRMKEYLLQNAGIDDAQFNEMYNLWKKHGSDMHRRQSELDSLRQMAMQETFKNITDTSTIHQIFDEIAFKQRGIEEANYHHFRKLRNICKTDRQRDMLDKMFRKKMMEDGPRRRYRGHKHRH
ncbi:MAG: hypothetical protein N4A74_13815 [Carboxylicivirga sp.]|nr:hypothetical protein [Carboxylicivirga sp.]